MLNNFCFGIFAPFRPMGGRQVVSNESGFSSHRTFSGGGRLHRWVTGMKTVKLWVAIVLLMSATRLSAYDYSNKDLGFNLKLPDGLEDVTSMASQTPDLAEFHDSIFLCLANRTSMAIRPSEVFTIADAFGHIGNEGLTPGNTPHAEFETATWKGLQLKVAKLTINNGTMPFVHYSVSIPLKPHNILLMVTGFEKDGFRLRNDFLAVLATVDGTVGTISSGRIGLIDSPIILMLLVGSFALITGRLRIAPRWGLIGAGARIAGCIYILGCAALTRTAIQLCVKPLASLGMGFSGVVICVDVVECFLILAVMALLMLHYGNSYEEGVPRSTFAYLKTSAPPKRKKKRGEAPDVPCPLCRQPVSPTDSNCPNCRADLTRWQAAPTM